MRYRFAVVCYMRYSCKWLIGAVVSSTVVTELVCHVATSLMVWFIWN